MKRLKIASLLAATLFASSYSVADSLIQGVPAAEVEKFAQEHSDKAVHQALPLNRVMVSQRGNLVTIMSDNGRYRFEGTLTDTWSDIVINNYEAAKFSAQHLDLSRIDFEPSVLNPIVYGSGDQEVIAFISPDDPASVAFVNEALTLGDDYVFSFVVIPNSSTPGPSVRPFACPDDGEQALEAISSQRLQGVKFDEGCSAVDLSNRMLAFDLLGLKHLPSIIAPSTRVASGQAESTWAQFLMENHQ